MGQALRKLESFYLKVESRNEINRKVYRDSMVNSNYSIEKSHIYNNLDNDDYYYKVLIAKSNALKKYLDRNRVEKLEEVENLTIRLVEKVENEYLSVEEAAKHLDCTTKTIRNRIKAGMPYETDKNKYMISIEILEKWRHGKPEEVEIPEIETVEPEVENLENENMEKVEPVNNSEPEILVTTLMSVRNNNFVTRDELNAYTVAINNFATALADIKQEGRHELDKQKEYFDSMLIQQQELTVSMFEELKREKDRQIAESKAALDSLREDMERREGDIITMAITAWRQEKEKERLSKRSWWRRLFKN